MRAMLVLVVGMGVLIVAGVAVVAVTIVSRMGHSGAHGVEAVLDQPAGTRIVSVAPFGNQLAVALQGGGADRVITVDQAGHTQPLIRLSH